ncbi:hypothetical protein ETD86_52970 [Nonomuraea turkmeniaca]|uniref:Uncharacterized protein n=1 Tax=Nonomuraea turkmeniaca TaxID=103838 RepID=A0A5S4EUQ7_9ACTN|nr:hypothetical protein [Nonomuraea turkmeniaca]TMR05731.1 hypothetical protein ETD86_52970 [Nonomuraea turkmeniaca]
MAEQEHNGSGSDGSPPADTGLFDERYNSPKAIRTIAEEMRANLDALLVESERERLDLTLNQLSSGSDLTTEHLGTWSDAQTFARTVGSENAGAKFGEVYRKFISAYQKVVEAVEISADNHDRARRENEGNA